MTDQPVPVADCVVHADSNKHARMRNPKELLRHLNEDHGHPTDHSVTVFGLCDIHDVLHGRLTHD